MDSFKPYREVVLPKKGPALGQKKPRPDESVPKPREFQRSGEFILYGRYEDAVLPEGPPTPKTHFLEGDGTEVPQAPVTTEESTVILPVTTFLRDDAEPATDVIDPEDLATLLSPEPTAEPPTLAAAELPAPVVEATPISAIVEEHLRDFIIAYDATFIGHYRSSRRITNRTAFRNVAKRLAEGFERFDLGKLELFRPVRLEIDPAVVDESEHDSFHWFANDSE